MSALTGLLPQLHLLRPWWLLGLVVLPLLAWWWMRRTAHAADAWRDVVDAHLLPHLLDAGQGEARRPWAPRLGLGALALGFVALAGPSLRKDETPLWQTREPLVVALDLSPAMLARDLPPTRLAQARAKLEVLLRERAGGQVALVAFAGDAYTVAPLTEDAANVALFLDALSPDVMPDEAGTGDHRVERAIAWSQNLLRQAGFARGQVLLLTDRADGNDIAAASRANAAGYKVSVLGVGTERGGVFDTTGSLGSARLDAASLRRLASAGGGRFEPLAPGDADLRALGVLEPGQGEGMAAHGGKATRWRDDGYWLLPLVLLLCLPMFRRGGSTALALACVLWLPLAPARAQAATDQGGNLWQRADQARHARMQEGIAAYTRKDYPRAIERFGTVDSAEGQYNLGNALAQAGRYDEAIAAYDRALKRQPGMRDASFNRALVRMAEKMPRTPGEKGQQGNQGAQGQQGPQQDRARNRPEDQQRQQGQQHAHQQQRGQEQRQGQQQGKQDQQGQQQEQRAGGPQPEPKPSSAQAQQQADAAQRQRMQEALQGGQAAQRNQGREPAREARGESRETAEERERRLANQAWLQRVPDDPGALLRARFQLEQQRRRSGGP